MSHHFRLATVLAVLILSCGTASAKKIAVLVGVDKYRNEDWRPLRYAGKDAERLGALLRNDCQFDTVIVLSETAAALEKNPKLAPERANIVAEIQKQLGEARKDDTVVLVFSGHGVQYDADEDVGPNGKKEPSVYFAPIDARFEGLTPKEAKESLIHLNGIFDALANCPASVRLLLADCCRDDALANPKVRSRGPNDSDSLPSLSKPQALQPRKAVVAFFGCKAGQSCYESDTLKAGFFIHYVIRGLEGEAADGAGQVTLRNLIAYVPGEVTRALSREDPRKLQEPVAQIREQEGTVVLRRVNKSGTGVSPFDRYVSEGLAEAYRFQHKMADEAFTKALADPPQDRARQAEAYAHRGGVRKELELYEKAREDLDRAIQLNPNLAFAYAYRAEVSTDQKRYRDAEADARKAIDLIRASSDSTGGNRATAYARYTLGLLYRAQGKSKEALAELRDAIGLQQGDPLFRQAIGVVYTDLERYNEAIREFDYVIGLYRESFAQEPAVASRASVAAHWGRARVFAKLGDTKKAIADLSTVIKSDESAERIPLTALYNERANLWIRLETREGFEAAAKDYSEALGLAPGNPTLLKNRGAVYFKLGRQDDALKDLNDSIRKTPDAEAFEVRAAVYDKLREPEKAKADRAAAEAERKKLPPR